MSSSDLTDEQLRAIYAWIDAIPLSRPKKNIARDFSDGVMLAEVVAAYFPQLVELHNYPTANSSKQKIYNHETLNQRVLKKFGFSIPRNTIEDIINCRPGAVEGVLNTLQLKMAKYREKEQKSAESRAAGGHAPGEQQQYIQDEPQQQQQQQQHHSRNPSGGAPVAGGGGVSSSVNDELLFEKEQQIRELYETVEILELKVAKLERLIRLKDNKIQKLTNK